LVFNLVCLIVICFLFWFAFGLVFLIVPSHHLTPGGLAGLCAVVEAVRCGATVVLIEKEKQVGGNSAKATSGINGWGTSFQALRGVLGLFRRRLF
jgi:hypothetical protein